MVTKPNQNPTYNPRQRWQTGNELPIQEKLRAGSWWQRKEKKK